MLTFIYNNSNTNSKSILVDQINIYHKVDMSLLSISLI